ncbi:hypothetical protein [Winogradskyella forsetii]|uniref:hypothetical protein n=1 Tax=Winogradskyella forsetii TaxID=2686077 RepID=UPI0015C01CBA|nr:hypothetical protein [Winogradskyella forsetii]
MEVQNKKENDSKKLINGVNPSIFSLIKGKSTEKYIMLPIDNYEHLGVLKSNLIEALDIIAHSRDWMPYNTSAIGATLSIIEIIKAMDVTEELSGLDEFLKVSE